MVAQASLMKKKLATFFSGDTKLALHYNTIKTLPRLGDSKETPPGGGAPPARAGLVQVI